MKVVLGKVAAAATTTTPEGTYGLIEHTAKGWKATMVTITPDDVSRKSVDLRNIPERRQLQTAFSVVNRASVIFLARGEGDASALSLLIARGLGHPHFWIDRLKQDEAIAVPGILLCNECFFARMKEPEEELAYA